jgi:DNA topoisomerase-2
MNTVKVYFNNELIEVNNLLSYSKLYDTPTDENLFIKNKNSEVLITPCNIAEFQQISFVNGVFTRLGGTHVDAWSEAIFRPLLEKFNKKDKPQMNIKDIKQFFRIFVVSIVSNPEFSSQEKDKLEAPKISVEVKQTDVNKILKWSVIDEINDIIKMKEMVVLKKSEKKKKGYSKVEGLDPANNAGGKLGYQCSLILCEGLSAKTYAVAGIQKGVYDKSGRDFFGVLSLSGKLLNVRNSIPTTISKNKVITSLIQSLNLKHDLDYKEDKNFKTLAYGKVILLTDSDVDGWHISGLIMNFLHYLFPSLLEREEPYLISMCTPIVRVFKQPKEKDLLFYDENRFRKFQKEQMEKNKTFKSKYYKGLGTTKAEDVPDTFGLKMIEYKNDDDSNTSMNKVFHKKFADVRKDFQPNATWWKSKKTIDQ